MHARARVCVLKKVEANKYTRPRVRLCVRVYKPTPSRFRTYACMHIYVIRAQVKCNMKEMALFPSVCKAS